MSDIFKSIKMIGVFDGQLEDGIHEFLQFLAMRHSKSFDEVDYKKLLDTFEEDYNFLEDKKSLWLTKSDEKGFEPSSDEGESSPERS